jgi:uncharacterized protein YqeY
VTPPLRDRLRADLPTAMRARDRARVAVLRSTLAAIENAEAVDADGSGWGDGVWANEVARRHLDEATVHALVTAERDRLLALAGEMAELGQEAEADDLAAQAAVLDEHLDHRRPYGSGST